MVKALRLRPERGISPVLRCHTGEVGGKRVLAAAGGMGGKRAGTSAAALIRDWQPDLLVMAGVAGALSPRLAVGEVIAGDQVLADGERWRPSVVPTIAGWPHHTGGILSLDRVLVTAAEKQSAFREADPPAPLAVEMETAAVARVTASAGVPWAALRAVSDTAYEALPLDFNRLRAPDGDLPVTRVALAAITAPGSIPGLIRLGRNTTAAANSLARFLEQWLRQL